MRQYGPSNVTLNRYLKQRGLDLNDLDAWGCTTDLASIYFPIKTPSGTYVFSGERRLVGAPKYVYPRGARTSTVLFGIDRAIKHCINNDLVVFCEGFSDVIACHKTGAFEAVSPLTAKISPVHAAMARMFASKAIIFFDGDEEGQAHAKVALRSIKERFSVISIAIDGLDPAAFVALGGNAFNLVNIALDYFDIYEYVLLDSKAHIKESIRR